jgi:uncharacterized protein
MQIITKIDDIILPSRHNQTLRPISVDITYLKDGVPKPVIVFVHGFKGFKDWGTWPLVAGSFAEAGFVFVKFNFSHNGTTPQQPTEFVDLEAFRNNTFSYELDDIRTVIDYVSSTSPELPIKEMDPKHIYLLGHSRGGGLAIITAAEDMRVKKLATWGAVNDFSNLWRKEDVDKWRSEGVAYIENSRTGQELPLGYQLYEDYRLNHERLDINRAASQLNIPFLIVHGESDETVDLDSAHSLHRVQPSAHVLTLDGAGHTFGGRHPYDSLELPEHTWKVIDRTVHFFKLAHWESGYDSMVAGKGQ